MFGLFKAKTCENGYHDWEVTDWKTMHDAANGTNMHRFHNGDYTGYVCTRVCLRCGKVDDQIAALREERKRRNLVKQTRQDLAKQILEKKSA